MAFETPYVLLSIKKRFPNLVTYSNLYQAEIATRVNRKDIRACQICHQPNISIRVTFPEFT